MRMPSSDKKFEVCPEFKGRAVCVDCTPLKRYETAFGPKDKFKLVFEVDLGRRQSVSAGLAVAASRIGCWLRSAWTTVSGCRG